MVKDGRLEMTGSMLLPSRDGFFAVCRGFHLKLYSFQLRLQQLARDWII